MVRSHIFEDVEDVLAQVLVMVTQDEMLDAVQRTYQFDGPLCVAEADISQDENVCAFGDRFIPVVHQCSIHRFDVCERPPTTAYHGFVAEVQIGREVDLFVRCEALSHNSPLSTKLTVVVPATMM